MFNLIALIKIDCSIRVYQVTFPKAFTDLDWNYTICSTYNYHSPNPQI